MKDNKYQGIKNLEVMAEAANYNNYLLNLIIKHCPKSHPILDFGAGVGTFDRELRKLGFKVTCIENDKSLIASLKKAGFDTYSDLNKLSRQFSYIFTLNVLEHIQNEKPVLKKLHRILTDGGKLLIYVPAFNNLFSSMDKKVGHYRRYTKQSLCSLLGSSDYSVTYLRYADSIGFFAALTFKLLGNNKGELSLPMIKLFDRYFFPLNKLLDPLFGRFFGKNLIAVASKRAIK